MTSGGHARSGPPKDPNSARSDSLGVKFSALPAEGFTGTPPKFPLPKRTIWNEYVVGDGKDRTKVREHDDGATESTWERELSLWAWAWSTPQACAWAKPSESWRLYSIAMWVRTFVICESVEATAADKGSLHRFADDIGLSPAGLRQNGWAIAHDEVAEKRADQAATETTKPKSSRDRMKVVKANGA